jgi:predicted transcriptional regulator
VAENNEVIAMTADIVSSYVSNNTVTAADLPTVIRTIFAALTEVKTGAVEKPPTERPQPAVPIKKAVQPDYVVDLFTGRKFKSLKRHLRATHNMTPEQYREYWSLPKDSPMVAPNYSAARSNLAKKSGLGQGGRKPAKSAKPATARKAKA